MLHRRGNCADVEALRYRIPLRQDAEKGPKMGSHGYRRLRRWKSGFVAPLEVFGGIRVYIGGRSRLGGHRGAHKVRGVPYPPRHALHPCGCLVALLTCTPSLLGVFCSKKIIAKVLFRVDSVWYSFFAEL